MIKVTQHEYMPTLAQYEADRIQRNLDLWGFDGAILVSLRNMALALPLNGSLAGFLWAMADHLSQMFATLQDDVWKPIQSIPRDRPILVFLTSGDQAILEYREENIVNQGYPWTGTTSDTYFAESVLVAWRECPRVLPGKELVEDQERRAREEVEAAIALAEANRLLESQVVYDIDGENGTPEDDYDLSPEERNSHDPRSS